MKKEFITYMVLFVGLVFLTSEVQAVSQVISGSKREIAVMVFNGTCDEKAKGADKFKGGLSGITAKSSVFDIMAQFKEAVVEGFQEEDCPEPTDYKLPPGKSIRVTPGQWIIAFKTGGNPTPAKCTMEGGKDIKLVTRKKLGIDLGLKCVKQ
ncbi:MAG: hypothetical protein ABFQ95_01705 [Pseudomonadota bacterium]